MFLYICVGINYVQFAQIATRGNVFIIMIIIIEVNMQTARGILKLRFHKCVTAVRLRHTAYGVR